jgi:hypothetical protein
MALKIRRGDFSARQHGESDMIKAIRKCFVLSAVILSLLLFSCPVVSVKTSPPELPEVDLPNSVKRIYLNHAGSGKVMLPGLANNDVFLVKVNTTNNTYVDTVNSAISVEGRRSVSAGEYAGRTPAGTITLDGQTFIRYERHWQGPPSSETALSVNRNAAQSAASVTALGDTREFYADVSSSDTPTPVTATLKYTGTYCKIWVANNNFDDTSSTNTSDNKVNQTQIRELAKTFDTIYPLETNLLGYEYGGGQNGSGGADGDPRIQILLCDIDGDSGKPRDGYTLGYFNPYDEYNTVNSNMAEIFYLDCEILDKNLTVIYSTLIHEFNHMINFNTKVIRQDNWSNWETWETEMLSMLAEDVIGPLIGINIDNKDHVINMRIPAWLCNYASYGVMQWDIRNPYDYYSPNYAFGAYLVRNFGGPALLSDIAKSSDSGKTALDRSLRKIGNVDLQHAMTRFGEALIYGTDKPAGVYSLNKSVTGKIGGYSYTFHAFDVDKIEYKVRIQGQEQSVKGPLYNLDSPGIQPYTIQAFRRENKTGNFDLQISGGNRNTYYFAMVK